MTGARHRHCLLTVVATALAPVMRSGVFHGEHRIVRPDCSVRFVLTEAAAIRGERGQVLWTVGVIQDITELRRTKEAPQRAQKLGSLEILAGAVAHDFKNLQAVMLGSAFLALKKLPPDSRVRANSDQAVTAVQRPADLAGKVLAYPGRGSVSRLAFPAAGDERRVPVP